MMEALEEKADRSTQFAFQLMPHSAFFGASPEKLFQRKERHLRIDAVAGTRKRGASPQEDLQLEKELMDHPKDRAEFNMVKDFISRTAPRLAEDALTWWESDAILKTAHVQHKFYFL